MNLVRDAYACGLMNCTLCMHLDDLIKQLKAKVFISFYVCVKYLVCVLAVWDGHGWMEIWDMGVMDVMEVCVGCAVGVVGQGRDWAMT